MDDVFVISATLIASNFPQGYNSEKEVVPEVQAFEKSTDDQANDVPGIYPFKFLICV